MRRVIQCGEQAWQCAGGTPSEGYDVLGIWNQNMNKSTDIKDLRERIDRMQNAIQPLLEENGAKTALWEE